MIHRATVLVPFRGLDASVEQRVIDQVELARDGFEVLAKFVAEGVPPRGDVVQFLEHRHVDVGLHIAHRPGVAIPIPCPADSARLVDDPDPFHTGLTQLSSGQNARHTSPDDHDVDLIGNGITVEERSERVLAVLREHAVLGQVPDGRPALDQPLIALLEILGVDRFGIEARRLISILHETQPTKTCSVPPEAMHRDDPNRVPPPPSDPKEHSAPVASRDGQRPVSPLHHSRAALSPRSVIDAIFPSRSTLLRLAAGVPGRRSTQPSRCVYDCPALIENEWNE